MPDPARKVAFRTLGCKVNRVESETAAARLLGRGWELSDADDAECIVVNTCTVTGEADAKARKEIRRALAAEGRPTVVVTGCLAALDPQGVRALGERVVVAADRDEVAAVVTGAANGGAGAGRGADIRPSAADAAFRTRAMLKVQDGCDAWCAYCIVPAARGLPRSRPLADVVAEARALAADGVAELVVTGINVGRYADDDADLASLIEALSQLGPRIRLSSVEPLDLTQRLLAVMADAAARGRFCPHLHVPLQSGSDAVLERMGRGYDAERFLDAIARARRALPGLALTTDIIAGLPGETDQDAASTLVLAEEIGFQRLHVFRYSRRTGTKAAEMPQVPDQIRTQRAAELRALSSRLHARAVAARLGQTATVLVERPDGTGTTEDHLTARVTGGSPAISQLVEVRLVAEGDDGFIVAEPLGLAGGDR